jgi:anti-sigma B factor antagonist
VIAGGIPAVTVALALPRSYSSTMERTFGVELSDGARRAKLFGDLDLAAYDDLLARLSAFFADGGDAELDLSGVTFVDSSAIRLFIQLHRARAEGGHLVLVAPRPQVERVLEVAGLDDLGIKIARADDD